MVPVSKGGRKWWQNQQPLCYPCNSAKGDKVIDYRPVFYPTLVCLMQQKGGQPNKHYFRRAEKNSKEAHYNKIRHS